MTAVKNLKLGGKHERLEWMASDFLWPCNFGTSGSGSGILVLH